MPPADEVRESFEGIAPQKKNDREQLQMMAENTKKMMDFAVNAKEKLKELKNKHTKKFLNTNTQLGLPKRLWQNLLAASKILENQKWAETTHFQLKELASQLTQSIFHVQGKSTFKEEFVTAGGIDLKEINFKRYESKIHKGLFFAGEVLNIDAITGGFNFQNAWTGGFIAAKAIATKD